MQVQAGSSGWVHMERQADLVTGYSGLVRGYSAVSACSSQPASTT
jgi:hypothetical protein